MKTINKIQLIIGFVVVVAAFILCDNLFGNRKLVYDHSPVDQLQKQEEQLKIQRKQLDSMSNVQAVLIEKNRIKDSILIAHYQSDQEHNKEIINQLIQIKNEKVSRIANYNSDSLRRAFTE
jgi:hypothetical protein